MSEKNQTLPSMAWDIWTKSEEGMACLKGQASGEYLKNRLWRAFMSGYGSRLEPERVEKGAE